jgi:hypothetical protein
MAAAASSATAQSRGGHSCHVLRPAPTSHQPTVANCVVWPLSLGGCRPSLRKTNSSLGDTRRSIPALPSANVLVRLQRLICRWPLFVLAPPSDLCVPFARLERHSRLGDRGRRQHRLSVLLKEKAHGGKMPYCFAGRRLLRRLPPSPLPKRDISIENTLLHLLLCTWKTA